MTAPSAIQQLRLIVGDVSIDYPFLDDNTYTWLIETYPTQNSAAVEALEMIINQIALSPQSIKTDAVTEVGPLVANLEARLMSLKAKQQASATGFPMIVKSGRTNWDDFNSLFPRG